MLACQLTGFHSCTNSWNKKQSVILVHKQELHEGGKEELSWHVKTVFQLHIRQKNTNQKLKT